MVTFSKSANNNKLIFKLCCNNVFKKVELMVLSLFDKFKRDNFWRPFLKTSGVTRKFSIHFYSNEQFLLLGFSYNHIIENQHKNLVKCLVKCTYKTENSQKLFTTWMKIKSNYPEILYAFLNNYWPVVTYKRRK